MRTYGVGEAYRHAFITLALDGGEWSASRSGLFNIGERISKDKKWGTFSLEFVDIIKLIRITYSVFTKCFSISWHFTYEKRTCDGW